MSGFSLAALKNTLDEVRVSVYAKNETEKKVYEALSSKNWGASSTQMNEIAQETHEYDKYQIINDIIWAALETEGKSWKQIFKALTLVEFLIKNGSERFIESARDKLFKIKRLQDYNYYEGTIDKGSGCREKAKQIVELLASNESIRAEREKARALRNKFGGVGSDSRGFGGGGSSSYGGSYGGSSDSYSNSGVDSRPHVGSSGRYGDDSYSSDRGNSRYDNDRYSDRGSANDRGSNNDRYNDRDRGGNTGRYGGGAYDSDRPPRFSDDGPQDRHDGGNEGRRGSYNARDDDVDVKPPSKSTPFAPKESNTAAGGKLKVSIKKAPAGGTVAAPPASSAAQVDLIGGDDFGAFGSAPAAPAAPAPAAAFDPFGAAPSAPAASSAAFDPFGSAPTQPTSLLDAFATPANASAPAQPAFDPFNQPAPAPYAQPGQNFHGMQPQMAPSQPQQQQFGQFTGFAAPAPAPLAPQPALAQQPMYRTAPAPAAPEADFGDFEEAKPAAPAKAAAANKWGDLGNLVDLGGISKNAPAEKKNEAAAAANAAYASSSFAGLDGFSKTQQNMNAGGMGAPRPMGAPMMAPRPGGPPMMMGGAPMGAPMGGPMGVPMGAPMGGMAPAGGMGYGAPAPHMGMMGPGMGAPMGMAPGGMGGYGAPAPHMGGGYGGPAPMGMGMGMGGMPPGNMGPGGYPPQQQYRPAGPGGW